ncbi:MAG TPA: hypothetical protein VFX30_00245 [bacterium]|nr:hypothetical protein [bacterium]
MRPFLRRLFPAVFLLSTALSPVSAFAKTPLLLITDPAALRGLEAGGLELSQVIGDRRSPLYASLVEVLRKDLAEVAAKDPKAGVGMRYGHRLFDLKWLSSPQARFELAGVANRLDRQPFRPENCGEIRLIYRLAYEKKLGERMLYSRLPMTLNVVFWALKENGDCRTVAARWMPENFGDPGALAAKLLSQDGPLSPERISLTRLKSVETNLQSVRWPATIRPDLGGHAEYILRVFHRDLQDGRLKPAPLENTPDVARLSKDPKLLEALKRWISDPAHFKSLDEGAPILPDEFLARMATSVSPHGWARRANRPFSALFREKDFEAMDFSQGKRVHSAKGLLRRLDDVSCMGCHQARSVAGFHLLGEDPRGTMAGNHIAAPASPHLQADLERRTASLHEMADTGKAIVDRPLSERADRGEGGWGAHCGLGDPTFATWTCNSGLRCVGVHGERDVGECFSEGVDSVGEPCQRGTFRSSLDAHGDGIAGAKANDCASGVCEAEGVGFPDGMCAVGCDANFPGAVCGAIAILTDFNACLARNDPFSDCLAKNVRPAGLKSCDAAHPCRDDYLCTRGDGGKNTCIPPYFLFQMRVDGHP